MKHCGAASLLPKNLKLNVHSGIKLKKTPKTEKNTKPSVCLKELRV